MPYMLKPDERNNWSTFCFYDKAFTPEECDKIIELGKASENQEATVNNNGANGEIRQGNLSWLTCNPDTLWIFDKLTSLATDANKFRYNFNLSGFIDDLQFTKYTANGDHYDWHKDLGIGRSSSRKLAMVLQLSNEAGYEGCELEFLEKNSVKVPKAKGTVIVFPTYEMHRVTPLISGERYSLVSWISGSPFA